MTATSFMIVPYESKYLREVVAMWRASFEKALGLVDPHPIEDQIEYFEGDVLPKYEVSLLREDGSGKIVGLLACHSDEIEALYVHVDYHRQGLGTRLLELAKAQSSGRLQLYTFERNQNAQRFYEHHGFRVIARGFEEFWQLADLRYEWRSKEGKKPTTAQGPQVPTHLLRP